MLKCPKIIALNSLINGTRRCHLSTQQHEAFSLLYFYSTAQASNPGFILSFLIGIPQDLIPLNKHSQEIDF